MVTPTTNLVKLWINFWADQSLGMADSQNELEFSVLVFCGEMKTEEPRRPNELTCDVESRKQIRDPIGEKQM